MNGYEITDEDLRLQVLRNRLWEDLWSLQRWGTETTKVRTGSAMHVLRRHLWENKEDPVALVRMYIAKEGGTSRLQSDTMIGVENLVLAVDMDYQELFTDEDRSLAYLRLQEVEAENRAIITKLERLGRLEKVSNIAIGA